MPRTKKADQPMPVPSLEALGKLSPFEGVDVVQCAIEIPGAAGGLRDALKFEPLEIHHGQEVVLVMKCRCKKVRFDEIKDMIDPALRRVAVLEPMEDLTTFIDEDEVREHLAAQATRVRKMREEAAGIVRLDAGEDEDYFDPEAQSDPEAQNDE